MSQNRNNYKRNPNNRGGFFPKEGQQNTDQSYEKPWEEINDFCDEYKKQKNPTDLSLLLKAEKIFSKLDPRCPNFVWSATAIMNFYIKVARRLEKGESIDDDEKKEVVAIDFRKYEEEARKIFEKIPERLWDKQVVSVGINLSKTEQEMNKFLSFAETKDFLKHDFHICSDYCVGMLKTCKKYEESLNVFKKYKDLFKIKAGYDKKKEKKVRQKRRVYDELISFLVEKENFTEALKLFEEALIEDIYTNNILKYPSDEIKKNTNHFVTLDFHLQENGNENGQNFEPGGIIFPVAEIAVLHFAKNYIGQGIHLQVKMITGGNHDKDDNRMLKKYIPIFLQGYSFCKISWNSNSKCFEFTVSFADMRKVCCEIEKQEIKEEKLQDDEASRKIAWTDGNCKADIVRDKSGKHYKQFSTDPLYINSEFKNKEIADKFKEGRELFKKADEKAREFFKECVDSYPEMSWTHEHLGWAYYRLHRYIDALNSYVLAEKYSKNPEQRAEINRKIGLAHYRAYNDDHEIYVDKCKLAVEYYKEAAAWDPENIEIYHNWGMALERLGQWKEAIEKFEKVIEKNPEHYEGCIRLGKIYVEHEDYVQAEKYYNEALKRNPASDWAKDEFNKLKIKNTSSANLSDENQSIIEEKASSFTLGS
jgi:tetratricopeptide (TPR) repeat protein